jgi:flagellar hook-associated protein 1 FlgK
MSTSALMSLGVRAMFASYSALQTTGHNIANANVDGYSRQQVDLATAPGQFTGAGFFGKGVDVASVTRSYNQFLTKQADATQSTSSMDQARLQRLQQLETVFPTGQQGIGYQTTQFLNSWSDLASNPQDASARQVVLSQAGQLAAQFQNAGTQLDQLQAGVNQDLQTSVAQINQIAASIANVNQQIAAVKGLGQPPNALLDQRDELISQLSGYVQVTTVPADDGTLGVFIGGGQQLVLGNQVQQLQVTSDPSDPSRSAVGLVSGGQVRPLDSSSIGGGSVAGILNFQNQDLVDARNQLGQLAAAIAGAVNQQQSLGLNLGSPPTAGSALFNVGAPQALSASTNQKDASGNYISSVTLTTVDASQLQASDYTLQLDASGTSYTLTRQSDGLTRTINSGDVVDGMRIDVGPPTPDPNDRFLLQPVARAANGMSRALDDPKGIAAASPVTASTAVTNTGTATVGSLAVTSSSIDPTLTASISFTSATGDYDWSLTDASGTVVSSGSATWTAGQPISLNGFALNLNGVPANGDSFTVSQTQYPASNNGNALAMFNLANTPFVGRTLDGGGNPVGGMNPTDAYASAMSDVGVRVQSAQSIANISSSMASQAEQARAGESGVNLDEEAAKLIQYQQSYQAAAKVLQVAQSVFDTLLQTASGN